MRAVASYHANGVAVRNVYNKTAAFTDCGF